MNRIVIRVDGSCNYKNPVVGVGIVIYFGGKEIYSNSYNCGTMFGSTAGTVSVSEWIGLLCALHWIQNKIIEDDSQLAYENKFVGKFDLPKEGFWIRERNIDIIMDSQYVVKTINGEYQNKKKHLECYYQEALRLLNRLPINMVRILWEPRECNTRADELSKEALKKEIQKPKWWDESIFG